MGWPRQGLSVQIHGMSDSDYANDPETRRSVSGYATFLNDAPVTAKSKMQDCVTLSVTEDELMAAKNVHKICCTSRRCWNLLD